MPTTFVWTDHYIDLLRKLWGKGKTGQDIARTFGQGCTRNAVISKVHRLGIDKRPSPVKRQALAVPHEIVGFKWEPEQILTLRQLWAQGRSPVEIAKTMGGDITPSRVSHKALKLKLPHRQPPITTGGFNSGWSLRTQARTEVLQVSKVAYAGKPLPLVDIGRDQCHFAVSPNNDSHHLFCGAPRMIGSAYCAGHYAVAYRPGPYQVAEKAA